jgi:surface antigen
MNSSETPEARRHATPGYKIQSETLMMRNVLTKLFVLLVSAGLVGCASNTRSENTAIGATTGAVVGGVAGSAIGAGTGQVAAIGAGVVVGALIGGYIGHSMDSSDTIKSYAALEKNPPNIEKHWTNKKTGHRYTLIPTSEKMAWKNNAVCRTYTSSAMINGRHHESNGTACRQTDGTWKTVEMAA